MSEPRRFARAMRRSSPWGNGEDRPRHAARLAGLVALVAAFYAALAACSEVTSADAIGAVETARSGRVVIAPACCPDLHALAILGAQRLLGDDRPVGWERAAQLVAVLAAGLASVPVYLVAVEVFEASTAWLGALLFLASPTMVYAVANLLGDALFVVCWTWALWAAIQFLRDGRWVWLPPFVAASTCAGSLRADGVWLAAAFWAVVAVMPWRWAAPVRRSPTWPAFLALSVVSMAWVAPAPAPAEPSAVALSGTAPGKAARRETGWQAAQRSVVRSLKLTRNAVSLPLLPLVALGLLLAWSGPAQARIWLLLGLVLAGGFGLMIERRAVTGACSVRDALVPGLLLLLTAGHGLGWLTRRLEWEGPGRGPTRVTYRPGPLLWLGALGLAVVPPSFRTIAPDNPRVGFGPYRAATAWLDARGATRADVIDFTGWTRFQLADRAVAVPHRPRWLVTRQGQVLGHPREHDAVAALVGRAAPAARFPASRPATGLQVWVYALDAERKSPAVADSRLLYGEKPINVKQ
jgi:hypothetical protein